MTCLALVCLAVSVSGEAPQSPWQSLTPSTHPVKQENNYNAKKTFDQGQAIAQLALTLEEEMLVEMLPFKPPFKMDKKQMAVVIKLLKKAVKPVLKSERLRYMVATVDGFVKDLDENQENKEYYIGMLNVAQDVYATLNRMYNSEEAQGRTGGGSTVGNIFRESVLNQWFISPFTEYVITPITSRFSSVFSSAIERVSNLIPENTLLIDTDWVNPFTSWGETFDYYVNRIADISARSRSTFEATARILNEQDQIEGRSCHGCASSGVSGGSDSGVDGSSGSGVDGGTGSLVQ